MDNSDYFNSSSIASQPLPDPSDTPYQTPFLTASSRRSSGRISSISQPSTPLALPTDDFGIFKSKDEKRISITQQDDLTPSLHASLVSEILALRRENESKDHFIDRLEMSLSDERSNSETLQEQLRKNSRESKLLKDQLKEIEESTIGALNELAEDRNAAKATCSELKKKLDISQRDLKAERDHSDRSQGQWEIEKTRITKEKAALMRRADLAESRLKALLQELAEQQMSPQVGTGILQDAYGPSQEAKETVTPQTSPSKKRGHRRNQSSVSTLASVRRSADPNGLSLADELNADNDDEDNLSGDEQLSPPDLRSDGRRDSRRSGMQDTKSQIFGMFADLPEPEGDMSPAGALNALENKENEPPTTKDGNVVVPQGAVRRTVWQMEQSQQQSPPEVEANQRRKRDPAVQQQARAQTETLQRLTLNRLSSPDRLQTSLASPPSATAYFTPAESAPPSPFDKPVMVSSSTQTEIIEEPPQPISALPTPVEIPSIAIHPPGENDPSSPGEAVLPPRTKSIGCQTTVSEVVVMQSTGMQTDIIRVDKRPIKLPPHLLPSALKFDEPQPVRLSKSETSSRAISPLPSPTDFNALATFDNGAFAQSQSGADANDSSWARVRRSLMMSAKNVRSLESDPFYGTDDTLASENDQLGHMSSARPGKRTQKYTRPSFDPPTPVPEDEKVGSQPVPARGSNRNSVDRSRAGSKSHSYSIGNKGRDSWRHSKDGSIKSGSPTSVASSSAWSKFTGSSNPPVPIPPRTSSVGMRGKRTRRTTSPPQRTSGSSSPTKRSDGMRITKKPVIRKVKSAAEALIEGANDSTNQPFAANTHVYVQPNEQSSSQRPESPVARGITVHGRNPSSQTRRLSSFLPTGNASVGSSIQHTVVDAIAQTMVGEWMWKYVQKRKTFGIPESTDASKTGATRHKRWVWLSPYDRTVMWSTKQPTNEAALMGKSGRKLIIQSVLDVKDDAAATGKTSRSPFNRSILILTPTRALKFTAISRERHYLWLTALSFLAHHTSQGSIDLSNLPRPFGAAHSHSDAVQSAAHSSTRGRSLPESETASRGSRMPWSYRARSSKQSSGYGTPSIPEASAENVTSVPQLDGTSNVYAPLRPNRAAPPIPTEHYFPDVALAPTIPRLPASRSSSRLNLHGRKRSASITGIMSTRPSTRTNNSGTSSIRSFPSANSAVGFSTNGQQNSNGPTTARSRRNSSGAHRERDPNCVESHPPLPDSHIAARHFAAASSGSHTDLSHHQQPTTPTVNGNGSGTGAGTGEFERFMTPTRIDSRPAAALQAITSTGAGAGAGANYGQVAHTLNSVGGSTSNERPISDSFTLPSDLSPTSAGAGARGESGSTSMEFGGNNNFFDAASRARARAHARYTTASFESDAPGLSHSMSLSDDGGPRMSSGLDSFTDAELEAEADFLNGPTSLTLNKHARGASDDTFDSVAPPPISTRKGAATSASLGHVTSNNNNNNNNYIPPIPRNPPPAPPISSKFGVINIQSPTSIDNSGASGIARNVTSPLATANTDSGTNATTATGTGTGKRRRWFG